ncbi:hypothetical protein LCGC14_0734220 [marine sediment metagenome]|uniref:Uncharacterized protein n=1 Tax=marine sediment metagenome TaxID=412755 RepID=A0A0F9Q8T6_9ZZZZ
MVKLRPKAFLGITNNLSSQGIYFVATQAEERRNAEVRFSSQVSYLHISTHKKGRTNQSHGPCRPRRYRPSRGQLLPLQPCDRTLFVRPFYLHNPI